MSDISGYRVGGTIHLIINNQIGFTTAPAVRPLARCTAPTSPRRCRRRSSTSTATTPRRACAWRELAFEYRQTFHKDVVIDMVCYRRYGHNEGDDPSYTQPLMYKAIAERRSVRKLYVEALVKRGDITVDEAESALADFQSKLQVALDETRPQAPADDQGAQAAQAARRAAARRRPASSVPRSTRIFDHLTDVPRGLHAAPQAGPPVRGPGQDCTHEPARSTGPRPRRWPSARWCSRARPCASPARTAAAARSASATPR